MPFEANRGQLEAGTDFVARGKGYTLYLSAKRARLHVNRSALTTVGGPRAQQDDEIGIDLVGANEQPLLQTEEQLPGYSNFLFGSDPRKWVTRVPQFGKVRYVDVYSGIDVVYRGNQDNLENDFEVLPGADAKQIALAFPGAHRVRIDRRGELILRAGRVEFRLRKPRAYQLIAGKRVEVQAAYVLRHGGAHFHLGPYDTASTLIIDPVLVYSTFLGGAFGPYGGFQAATAAAVDQIGNLYITGVTDSSSFPVTAGVLRPTLAAAFVSKLDPTGTSLIYSTYVGGFSNLGQYTTSGLAVDSAGNIYIAGRAEAGLPIPNGSTPFQPEAKSLAVLKLNNTGTAVLAGTYLGGSGTGPDLFGGIAVDSAGSVYMTGTAVSADFPLQNPLQGSLGTSGQNAFVTKFNPKLSSLEYSTYLGQNSAAGAAGIALDAALNAYIVGSAGPAFPTTTNAFQKSTSLGGPFFAKLDPTGSSVIYATYLTGSVVLPSLQGTGSLGGGGAALAVDPAGNVFLAGGSASVDFPFLNPIQSCPANVTTFLAEFDPTGALVFSTCLGNLGGPTFLAMDGSGKVYVSGISDASLPLKNPIESSPAGTSGYGLYISEIDPSTKALLFSSFIAGPTVCCDGTEDHVTAITVDSNGDIYAVGFSGSLEPISTDSFPIFNALQPLVNNSDACTNKYGCSYAEAIIMKISPGPGSAAAVSPSQLQFSATQIGTPSTSEVLTVYDMGTDPLAVSNVMATGDFGQTNNCEPSVAPAASCAIQVTFTPAALGTRTGVLTITDGSPGSPHTIPLSGLGGQASLIASPSSLSFPTQLVGTQSQPQTIDLTDGGTVDLHFSNLQIQGPFTESLSGCDNGPPVFGGCEMEVTFAPTAAGPVTGTITITDNAPDSPQTISLRGSGATDFIVSTSTPSATVSAGATATFSLTATAASSFSGTVNFTCMGAPTASACTISPNSVTLSGGTFAQLTATVTTTARSVAQLHTEQNLIAMSRFGRLHVLLGSSLFGFLLLSPGLANKKGSKATVVVAGIVVISAVVFGCGGGNSTPTGTPSGTYAVTVTGTSGATTESVGLMLTVQ